MTNVQPCHVYGLPNKDTMPALSEADAFRFGYQHALQGKVAIYMGPHVDAFKSGCVTGTEVKEARAEARIAAQEAADLRDQRTRLVDIIKQQRAELADVKQTLAHVNRALYLTVVGDFSALHL